MVVKIMVPYYNTAPNIYGTQKGTTIFITTHIGLGFRDGPAAVDAVQNVRRDWGFRVYKFRDVTLRNLASCSWMNCWTCIGPRLFESVCGKFV